MKRFRTCAVAILFLCFAAFAWSQADQRDEPKPQDQEARPEKPEAKPQDQQMKPPKADKDREDKADKEDKAKAQDEARPAQEEHGEKNQRGEAAQSGAHARPAGKSAHIPDDKFKAHFGRQHNFKVTQVVHQTVVVPGQTQFVYSGYTFVIVDAWPSGWAMSDDCYIDYIDGDYFLVDVLNPGFRVALFVVG